ncbi:MAG TPA: HPF/RaiA family ribosome-associated protein [Methylomirabilota bacterium]|jgi:ribosome-associated translation inhibitor RaiA
MKRKPARPRSSPVPSLKFVGLAVTPALRTHVAQRLRRALAGVRTSPVYVRVVFRDVNGPKGGLDVRCAIDVKIPKTAPLHAEETAERDIRAFDRSAAMIARRIKERLGRRQESSRRPKKYFTARRLLS